MQLLPGKSESVVGRTGSAHWQRSLRGIAEEEAARRLRDGGWKVPEPRKGRSKSPSRPAIPLSRLRIWRWCAAATLMVDVREFRGHVNLRATAIIGASDTFADPRELSVQFGGRIVLVLPCDAIPSSPKIIVLEFEKGCNKIVLRSEVPVRRVTERSGASPRVGVTFTPSRHRSSGSGASTRRQVRQRRRATARGDHRRAGCPVSTDAQPSDVRNHGGLTAQNHCDAWPIASPPWSPASLDPGPRRRPCRDACPHRGGGRRGGRRRRSSRPPAAVPPRLP